MKSLLFTGILCLFTVSIFAQRQLTFDEAVAIALQKNVDLKIQSNEVDRAAYQRTQSIVEMAPSLRLNSDIFGRRGRQQIQNPETNQVEFLDVVSDNLSLSLNASMPVFNGLTRIQTLRSDVSNLRSQEYGLEATKQATIFNVAQQYLQVLLSEELYRIAQDNYRNQTENLKRIEGLVSVGALAIVDAYNQKAEVMRLESLLIRAKNTFENDKLILAQTLLLEPGTDFDLSDPNISIDKTLELKIDLDELFEVALSSRPDYNRQKELVTRNSRTVSALRGTYFPSVTAFYNFGSFYNSRIPFNKGDQLSTVNPFHFYGFSISMPIIGGFNTRNRVQSAKIDRENSVLQERALKTVIYTDVSTAYQNFEASKAAYLSSLAQLEAANAAYSLEKERYELGLSTFFEFSTASNALTLAQASKAQAEFTLMFQETILNYRIGQLKHD